ncbi:MAG: thioredoxin family protein [Patescibacteria group bacterium]|jgi:thioredoxin 1
MKIFDNANFDKEVIELSKTKLVFVDFYAPWCGTCKLMEEVVKEAEMLAGDKAVFGQADIDANPELMDKYEVLSLPTFKIFKDGQAVGTLSGIKSKEDLLGLLEK